MHAGPTGQPPAEEPGNALATPLARKGPRLSHPVGTITASCTEDLAVINPKLATHFDRRWPQGMVGRRETLVVKNSRIYLASPDGLVTKIGWGDLCLERWHILREVTRDGIGLVAFENRHGTPPNRYDPSEGDEATLEDLIPGLALALNSDTAVLLNHPDPDLHTLGAVSLPALGRRATRMWVAERLADLPGFA